MIVKNKQTRTKNVFLFVWIIDFKFNKKKYDIGKVIFLNRGLIDEIKICTHKANLTYSGYTSETVVCLHVTTII